MTLSKKFNRFVYHGLGFVVLNLATQQASADLTELLTLPDDWQLSPLQDYSCGSRSGGQGGSGNSGENSYAETSSKFLTWLTGTVELAEYEPIGEVANYFGFAAMRSEIRERNGSQGDVQFRGSIYREILELLDDSQRAVLYDLMVQHRLLLEGFLEERVNLIHELWALKAGESIDFDRITELTILIGNYEGAITVTAAQAYAKLTPMLTAEQLDYLWAIRQGDISTSDMRNSSLAHADKAEAEYTALDSFDKEIMQEVASKVISWVTGSTEDALYLPPGKIGNFFGFANYRYVDRAAVSRGGAAALVHDLLDDEQRSLMCDLSWAVVGFTEEYIGGRADLIVKLSALKEDPSLAIDIKELSAEYAETAGIGEGRRATLEAMTFHTIASMLSEEQIAAFDEMRVQSTASGSDNNEGGNNRTGGNGQGGQNRTGGGGNGGGNGGNGGGGNGGQNR